MAEASAGTGQHLRWQNARVEALDALTPTIRRITLRPQHWHQPLAGQHLDVRLTADDGYQAQRSYSLLSPPQREGVYELGIERLADGEVSPWFHDAVQVGESIEVLGPVGGHFVWRAQEAPPTLLIGGGSGVVPLLAMAAHGVQSGLMAPMVLMVAARTLADVPLWTELQQWQAQSSRFQCRLALSRETTVPRVQGAGQALPVLQARLMRAAASQLAQAQARLEARGDRLEALSPQRVLERGYAWLADADGHAVTGVEPVRVGQAVSATLADGLLQLRVTDVQARGESHAPSATETIISPAP